MIPRESVEPPFGSSVIRQAIQDWGLSQVNFVRVFENVVYEGFHNGARVFLRITPSSRRSLAEIQAEIKLLNYLKQREFPATRPVAANSGDHVVQSCHADQVYFLALFDECPGEPVSAVTPLDPGLARACGRTMGWLHSLLLDVEPGVAAIRKRWQDDRWPDFSQAVPASESEAWQVHDEVFSWCNSLEADSQLIHGDFTIRNFHCSDNGISLFDFDGCCTHYPGYEIACFFHHFRHLQAEDYGGMLADFLSGYAETNEVTDELRRSLPMFARMKLLRSFQVVCEELMKDDQPELRRVQTKRRLELLAESPMPLR